jgi:hypothetical protein
MMDELRTMMADNAWQSYPEFRSYMKGREGLPLLGNIDAGGREFIDAAASAFFDIFLSSIVKHVEEQWTSEMLLPYIIGGSSELAGNFFFGSELVRMDSWKLTISISRTKKSSWRTSKRMAKGTLLMSLSA